MPMEMRCTARPMPDPGTHPECNRWKEQQLAGISHIELPRVSYIELRPRLALANRSLCTKIQRAHATLAAELDGIIKEVGQRDLKQLRIARRAKSGSMQTLYPGLVGIPEPGDDGASQRCQITHVKDSSLSRIDSEQIVDQMPCAALRTDRLRYWRARSSRLLP